MSACELNKFGISESDVRNLTYFVSLVIMWAECDETWWQYYRM